MKPSAKVKSRSVGEVEFGSKDRNPARPGTARGAQATGDEPAPEAIDIEPEARASSISVWYRRARPVLKYGLAAALLAVILGSSSTTLPLTHQQLEYLVVCSGIAILLLLVQD